MTKDEIAKNLGLVPLEVEGGMYREVYRSALMLDASSFPKSMKAAGYGASTSIYYLLGAADVSSMHSVSCDETWHFYAASDSGFFIRLIAVSPEGIGQIVELGARLELGQRPQFTVPAGWAMGGRIASVSGCGKYPEQVGAWILAGATVAPSFEFADFKKENAADIAKICPKYADYIKSLG